VRYGEYEGSAEGLIQRELDRIEQERGVRILHAVESGSRAWGFASPDSDYDVRFIYVSSLEHYLSLRPAKKDTIDWVVNETLDICGWDLSKALSLARKGNPHLYEWAASPVMYRSSAEWGRAWEVARTYFACKPALFGYYGIAQSTKSDFLMDERVRYKKYLYALRPLLACKYIDENRAQPPVDFHELVRAVAPESLKPAIEILLARKATMNEKDTGPRIPEVDAFIDEALVKYGELAKELDDDAEKDWGPLDRVFFKLVATSTGR